jgi:3-deoxy-D-manno-octulosonic-acid transferase
VIRSLYSLVLRCAQPLLRRKLRRRGVAEPGYLQHVDERFGRYQGHSDGGRIWIHAVSLGETRAAAILLEQLRAERPDVRVLLTHGTATGRAEGQRLLRAGDAQAWLPWDTPQAVQRFLQHFRPRIGVLMETEVWPNLAAGCARQGVPLVLANARLSEQSMRRAMWLGPLARPAYASLAAAWPQTDADARRLARVGAPVGAVFGNLKFDASCDGAGMAQGQAWRTQLARPVLLFASSREGEEAQLFAVLARHRARESNGTPAHVVPAQVLSPQVLPATVIPAQAGIQGARPAPASSGSLQAGQQPPAGAPAGAVIQWLVVPRHPQRFDEVAALALRHGFTVSRRSGWADRPQPADIWLGDSLGEMALYYALADVALLGGSFEPLGGQNLIEAAACGCPVVMGRHTFNFSEAAQLAQEAGAALRVESVEAAVAAAAALADDAARRAAAAAAALAFAAAHRGAARKTALALLALANA